MAYVRRVRRRRGARGVGGWFRARLIGLAFLAFAVIVTASITYLMSLIPSNYVYVYNGSIAVSSTVPSGATGLDVKVLVGILGWGTGIFLFISAIRRLGVRL